MNAWEKYKQDREKRKQEETEKFSGSSAWETYKAGRKAEAEQPASSPVRKTMLAAEKDGFQRENLYEDSVGETSLSYEELADMTLQERLARSQLGQQEAAKNMLKDAGYVGERFGLGVATGLEGLADAAILAKAQGILDSPTEKTGKAIADLLGIRKKTTEELMAENLAKQALANQATAPWQASIEDRYDPNRVTETVGEIGQTIGNMAPSIVGNILLPGIGIPVMGVAAGGQGAQQAYQETADLKKATLYGMATGGLEAGTELLFGGLAGLGKGVADTAVGKVVKKAASALGDSKAGKVISGFANSPVVKAVADSLGEGVEEVIATYLDPFLQRVIYNPNAQNATAEELIQSGLMGMLVGGVFQAGNAALGGLMGEGYVPPKQVEPEINEMDAAPVQTVQGSNAVDNQPEQTHLSNKQVERMIRDEATMQEMGIDTNGKTMSQLRNEVRARMAAQEQGTETSSEENRVQTPAEETAPTTNPAVTEETQAEQVVNTRTEGITNGEEVYLRNGSQRAGSANPGGQVSAVEESTGRVESGQAERQVADRGAAALTYGERVSTNSLGIGGGSIKNNIRLLKSGDTQHTAEAKRIAKERGLRVYFFADDNLSIRQKNGEFASVRGYITGDRVFIRADHPLYTADQIMRHEVGHDMIAKGEVDLGEVRKRVKKAAGGREVRRIAKMYAEAYAGTDMTAEDIWEEVICDSLGDMNIFSGKIEENEAGVYLTHTKEATQADVAEISQERSPPDGKMSRDLDERRRALQKGEMVSEVSLLTGKTSRELDNSYMAAVERGDMEAAQRMVDEVAKNAMPDSKIRTEDGKLRIVYHGTNTGDFTVFNPDYIGMSSGDDGFFGMGFYFAYSKGEASYYGARRIIPAYLNLKNPFNFERELQTYKGKKSNSGYAPDAVALMNFADKFPDIAKNVTIGVVEKGSETGEVERITLPEFAKAFKDVIDNKTFEYQELTNEYGEKETLVIADPETIEYEYNGEKHSYKDYGFQRRFWGTPNEMDVAYEYLANSVYEYVDVLSRTRLILDNNREFTAALKAMDYDGVIQSDYGDEAVAFYPEQIKSAEPVTYDDDGNVIPLSERFNPEKVDIRYSMEPTSEFKRGGKETQSSISDEIREEVRIQLARMGKEYGFIPAGETPYREAQVPRRTERGNKVSQTVRTILEAQATPDEMVPNIEKLVADGKLSYSPISDESAVNEATAYIERVSWDTAQREWFSDMKKGVVSKANTTLGWLLYNNAANEGNTKLALDILNEMVKSQRSAAQALQATRILKTLSPETQLYGAQKSVEGLTADLKKRYGDDIPDLKIDPALAEKFLNARTDKGRTEAMQEIYRDIGRQMPSRFIDKFNAWRYLAMLGNPRTHVRNIVGNAGFAPVVAAKNLTATAIERVVLRNSDSRTKSVALATKEGRALLKAAWADYANVTESMPDGKYSDHKNANRYIEEGRVIFGRGEGKTAFGRVLSNTAGKLTEKVRRFNSGALAYEDMWFAKPHYASALAQYCKAHGITVEELQKGTSKRVGVARNYAMREAQKATYQDANEFSEFFSRLGRNPSNKKTSRAMNALVEGVLPFRKTPANILVRSVEYSPLGLVRGLKNAIVDVRKGNVTASEAVDRISSGLTGTALLGLGVWLAAEGLVRGHGDDEKEKEKDFTGLQGHQGYALELPDGTSITLDWLAPEALPFFIGVNLWEMTSGMQDAPKMGDILGAVSNVSEPLLEMSCLQGLNDLLDSVGYASSEGLASLPQVLISSATSLLTQMVPTLLGQIERTGEPVRMTTYTDKNKFLDSDTQYFLGRVTSRIPGLDYGQIPYIDAWGRTESNGNLFERAMNNFLNPAYMSEVRTSAMEQELNRLYSSVGETELLPSRAPKSFTVSNETVNLTAEQYVEFSTYRGQRAYDLLTELTESKRYSGLDDKLKASAVKKCYSVANEEAKALVSEYNLEKFHQDMDKAEAAGISGADYILFYVAINEMSSVKDSKGNVIKDVQSQVRAWLEKSGFTRKQKETLWSTRYKSAY